MNIPDHISGTIETIFWVKNTYMFLDANQDLGSGIFFGPGSYPGWKNRIRDKHSGFATLLLTQVSSF
jgi:hypothetical protein